MMTKLLLESVVNRLVIVLLLIGWCGAFSSRTETVLPLKKRTAPFSAKPILTSSLDGLKEEIIKTVVDLQVFRDQLRSKVEKDVDMNTKTHLGLRNQKMEVNQDG